MSKLLRIIRKLTRARGVAVSAVGRSERRKQGGEGGAVSAVVAVRSLLITKYSFDPKTSQYNWILFFN